MSSRSRQGFWAPGRATLRFPPWMRLARVERERLYKGLERFVNCGDSLSDFQALGKGFPDFWPVKVWHCPNQEHPPEQINWDPACHKLFLFYRDTLRAVWSGNEATTWSSGGRAEFLLGLLNLNEDAREVAKRGSSALLAILYSYRFDLDEAWREILRRFPTAAVGGQVTISMLWGYGDFFLMPENDFQKAFYLLFRQGWRARVCPRCKMFFVARRPKQSFCGTTCSAGSRLASKRKWWHKAGARRRKAEAQSQRKREKK